MSTALQVPESVRVGPDSAGVPMTPEEFDAIEDWDEGYVYELIHGVLVVSPPPLEMERGPNQELGRLLLNYRYDHPQGRILDGTLPGQTFETPTQRRRADRVVWAGLGRTPNPRSDIPTIVVEFVSAGRRNWRRDYLEKRDEYLLLGVREYWIIDRFRRVLTVVRPGAEGPIEQTVNEPDTYRTDLLPGFELPVGPILAIADTWAASQT
jgi:Uma2 family endonuclease